MILILIDIVVVINTYSLRFSNFFGITIIQPVLLLSSFSFVLRVCWNTNPDDVYNRKILYFSISYIRTDYIYSYACMCRSSEFGIDTHVTVYCDLYYDYLSHILQLVTWWRYSKIHLNEFYENYIFMIRVFLKYILF